jgi:hypothetical protein
MAEDTDDIEQKYPGLLEIIREQEQKLYEADPKHYRPPTATDLMYRRDVAATFPEHLRNPAVPFDVHGTLMGIADVDERQRLLWSGVLWTVPMAQKAVLHWRKEHPDWDELDLRQGARYTLIDGQLRLIQGGGGDKS